MIHETPHRDDSRQLQHSYGVYISGEGTKMFARGGGGDLLRKAPGAVFSALDKLFFLLVNCMCSLLS